MPAEQKMPFVLILLYIQVLTLFVFLKTSTGTAQPHNLSDDGKIFFGIVPDVHGFICRVVTF